MAIIAKTITIDKSFKFVLRDEAPSLKVYYLKIKEHFSTYRDHELELETFIIGKIF